MQLIAVVIALTAGAASAADRVPASPDAPRLVLILDSSDPSEPVAQGFGRAIRQALTEGRQGRVEFFSEFLDSMRMVGGSYEAEYVALLRSKHRDRPPDLVVTVYPDAVAFLDRHRNELWPDTPSVYVGVPDDFPAWSAPTALMTGVRTHVDLAGTIDLALALQPRTRRVVVVSGIAEFDRWWRERARQALEARAESLDVVYLDGLAASDLRERLSALSDGTIVLYSTAFRDADGPTAPIETLERIVAASPVPVYSPFEPLIGLGILGGNMVSLNAEAVRAGRLARAILDGQRPDALTIGPSSESTLRVDWRQLRRFGLSEGALPPGTSVLFRPTSVWREYRGVIAAVLVILSIQFGLIAWLLVERHQRQRAELRSREQGLELAHAARLATVGEITASIAHQINQPLGAILSNADAADMLLDASPLAIDELRQILGDIRRDDLRAHEVIQGIRAWLRRREFQMQPVAVNGAITEVLQLLDREAQRHAVTLRADLRDGLPVVTGDRVHLQQVIMNLVMNALEAAAGRAPGAAVTVRTALAASGDVEIAVSDTGPGIPSDDVERVFDSFFSTKREGMGLGLSIARSLVELHGGRIAAANDRSGGATFRVTLPAGRAAAAATTGDGAEALAESLPS